MVARQVQRICPHRVMRGSRDGGAQGCSLHRMRGCCGAKYLLGQAFQAVGWGGLSRWESYNDRAIARVGDREGQEAQGGTGGSGKVSKKDEGERREVGGKLFEVHFIIFSCIISPFYVLSNKPVLIPASQT